MLSISLAYSTDENQEIKRVALTDGSILFGSVESAEDGSDKTVNAEFGEVILDETYIENIRPGYESFSIYEEWEIESIQGEAKAILRIKLPESDRPKFVLPVIESRYQVTINEVRSFDNERIKFFQIDRGPITLIEIEKKNLDRDDEYLLVKIECENAFVEREGSRFLQRSFSSDLGSTTNVKITTSESVSIRLDEEELETYSFCEELLRHQKWSFEIEVIEATSE